MKNISRSWGLLALLACGLSGCASAEIVRRVHEPKRGGTAKIRTGGVYSVAKGRALAESQARELCGGDFRVTEESDSTEFAGATYTYTPNAYSGGGSGMMTPVSARFTYMNFVCD